MSVMAMLVLAAALEWMPATVIEVRYKTESPAGIGRADQGLIIQTVRGQWEFDVGDALFTAGEHVAANARSRIQAGDKVEIAIDKKALLVRVGQEKPRKLKLLGRHPKTGR